MLSCLKQATLDRLRVCLNGILLDCMTSRLGGLGSVVYKLPQRGPGPKLNYVKKTGTPK